MNNLSMYSGCIEVVDNEAILESTLQDTGKNVRDVERQRLPQDGGTHTCSASEYVLRMLVMLKIPVEKTKKEVRVLTVLMATIWTPSMHPCRAKKESPSATNTRAPEQTESEQQPKTYWNSAVHVTAVFNYQHNQYLKTSCCVCSWTEHSHFFIKLLRQEADSVSVGRGFPPIPQQNNRNTISTRNDGQYDIGDNLCGISTSHW